VIGPVSRAFLLGSRIELVDRLGFSRGAEHACERKREVREICNFFSSGLDRQRPPRRLVDFDSRALNHLAAFPALALHAAREFARSLGHKGNACR
jgi:hypothetical protein